MCVQAFGTLWAYDDADRSRLDLYQRLAGLVLELPALASRGDDMLMLARHFAAQRGRSLGNDAAEVLQAYEWPGNVRELKAAVERATFLTSDAELMGAVLAEAIRLGLPNRCGNGHGEDATRKSENPDRARLLQALARAGWHAGQAAAALGMARSTFFRRCKIYGISVRSRGSPTSPETVSPDVSLWDSPPADARDASA